MLTPAPHQQRVLEERRELAEKLDRLNAFRATETFAGLSLVDQGLLVEQATHMQAYRDVLDARIRHWGPASEGAGA